MPLTNGHPSTGVRMLSLCLLIAGVSCPVWAGVPEQVGFQFGGQFSLRKQGGCVTIARSVEWGDAQRSPGSDFDASPRTVVITLSDFAAIWDLMKQVDWARLKSPSDRDFELTFPDQAHVEVVRLVVDGKTMVDWSRSSRVLVGSLRDQFGPIVATMSQIYQEREAIPVMPEKVEVELRSKASDYLVVKQGSKASIQFGAAGSPRVSGEAVAIDSDGLDAVWQVVMEQRLMDLSYDSREPGRLPSGRSPGYTIRIELEDEEVLNAFCADSSASRTALAMLGSKLEELWQESYRHERK